MPSKAPTELVQIGVNTLGVVSRFFEDAILTTTYVIPYIAAGSVLRTLSVETPAVYTVVSAALGMVFQLVIARYIIDDLETITQSILPMTSYLSGPDLILAVLIPISLFLVVTAEIVLFRTLT